MSANTATTTPLGAVLDLPLVRRMLRRSPVWQDVEGWVVDPRHVNDRRTPSRPAAGPASGPWWVAEASNHRPAHGIYTRPAGEGLTDWAAAVDGWMVWRWSGPEMAWSSPLVSPWTVVLGGGCVLGELSTHRLRSVLGRTDAWTARALLCGDVPAGEVDLGGRRRTGRWVAEARAAGLEVLREPRARWACAALPGTFRDHFDLAGLIDAYGWVLPAELAEEVADVLTEYAPMTLVNAVLNLEHLTEVLADLVLGFPPEITAAAMTAACPVPHHRVTRPAEAGAYCASCDPANAGRRTP